MCTCKSGVCTPGVKCGHKCITSQIMNVLVIIGGLNWGLVGVGMLMDTNLNVVNLLLGSMPTTEAVIYLVVGIATLGSIFGCPCKTCKGDCSCSTKTETPGSNSAM